ncbi:PREDICTED: putative nuclease HARBI1 [Vollenhovia emeryi]|uniref:putative nuclease HARBI1 n=1 Tax=Vollenhovia emeryi TaxID=411798 RepID=UPI0005F4A308|nr:PREDICTED: putative nuclease HARBI1 [Vollenhovia emeryi]
MRFLDVDVHVNYCRMSIQGFDYLLSLVGPLIQKMTTNFREPISSRTRLYLTLRYLATGDSMTSIAYAFRIGYSTASTIISETCQCLWDVLQSEMFVPSEDNWKKVAKEFNDRWNFPHCIGAIDGKHVTIKAPPESGSTFYNYKGCHSINLMAIASAFYQFLLVDIGAEGRHSDGGVFKNSAMGKLFAANAIHVPAPCPIVENGELMPYVLVADEAFQLINYTMRSYPGKTLTE